MAAMMIARRTAREVNWIARRRLTMDRFGMVRKLVDKEIPPNQAEVITSVFTDIVDNLSNALVSKEDMKLSEAKQNADFAIFKSEIKSLQENKFSFFQRELEKTHSELQKDVEMSRYKLEMDTKNMHSELMKEHSELKMDVSKVLSELILEFEKLRLKSDVALHDLEAKIWANKYDVMKYYLIGGFISLSALAFSAMRLLK